MPDLTIQFWVGCISIAGFLFGVIRVMLSMRDAIRDMTRALQGDEYHPGLVKRIDRLEYWAIDKGYERRKSNKDIN